MEFFEALSKAWATESPTVLVVCLFIGFGVYLIQKMGPAGKTVSDLGEKFIDDVARPMIPLASSAISSLEIHGKAIEAQTRCNQQLIDAVQAGNRDTRELFEQRILQEKKERETQVKALLDRIKELESERDKLKAENKTLKTEVEELRKKLESKDKPTSKK